MSLFFKWRRKMKFGNFFETKTYLIVNIFITCINSNMLICTHEYEY